MRPLSLDLHGFTCFRDPQPPLDLSEHTLFAITGPTGAGKSSLLDAMTFALYGKVPRMGRGSVKDLISHGRDRLSVTLTFAIGERTFVVTRMTRRSGAAGVCQLDERVGNAAVTLASGVRDVDTAVQRLVGLDYDGFTQAVVLPQGEFARFLKGAPAQRRQILQDLLRLGVYGRMQTLAGQRWRDARKDVELAERELEACADATPAAITAAERELAESHARHAGLAEARDTARASRVRAEARAAVAAELDARREERNTLLEEEPHHLARLDRVAKSRRARQLSAELTQHARDEAVHRDRAEADARARSRLSATRRASDASRARLQDAQRAVADLAPLRSRADALKALEGRLQLVESIEAECADLARERDSRRDEVKARRADRQRLDQVLSHLTDDVARFERALSASTFDPAELSACEAGRDLARELRSAREQGPALDAGLKRSRRDVADAEHALGVEAATLDETRAARVRAEQAREAAIRRLTDAQDMHRAMTLRSHLHAGDACPVCAQPVLVVPPVDDAPELAALLDAQNESTDACRMLDHRLTRVQEQHVRAAATVEGARGRLAALTEQQVELRTRVASSITALGETLAPYLPSSSAAMPEHWLLERLAVLQGLRAEREHVERQRQVAEASRVDAAHRVALVIQATELAERELAAFTSRLASRQSTLAEQQADIRRITGAPDPRAELADLASRIIEIEGALDAARVEAMQHDTELAAALEGERLAARALAEATQARDEGAARIAEALAAAGFTAVEDAVAALLPDADLARLEDAAEEYARRRSTLETQVADLETRLGPEPTGPAVVRACVDAERAADEAILDDLRRTAQLEVRLSAMRARALAVAAAQSRLAVARQAHDVFARLAAHLKADAFQAWLLREAFEQLVAGASTRLMELSGRYTLQWVDDEFVVVDHDNAQERRAADTLSGGETFLASLALALELSEQVQRAAGAVRLDSLFIDEGFGTLDAASQDVVASAIESLQVSGRIVGIITHVRELTERMPACIVIEKQPDGSRWSLR